MAKTFKSLTSKARQISGDKSGLLPHGGQVRFPGPYPEENEAGSEERIARDAEQMAAAVEDGMEALRDGTSPFARDMEPAGEPQIVEYFDVNSGEYVFNWIVWCRQRDPKPRVS